MKIMMTSAMPNKSYKNSRKFNRLSLLIMAFPFLVLLFVFYYGPLYGWIYAFFDYKPGIPLFESTFTGIEHFIELFAGNNEMWKILRNTLVLSFLNIFTTPLPVVFAILLTEARGKIFKKLVQTTTTLPNFISWILVYALFFYFFSADGLLNTTLRIFDSNAAGTNVLGNDDIAWFFQTFISVWKSLGWTSIIYLAAISGIDQELYDAVKVDGAGRFRSILHVTVPGIASTYVVILMLTVCSILSNGFEQYFVFYNALVANHIEVLDYYVYRVGLIIGDYPSATAIGISKTLISILLLFTVNTIAKKLRGQSIL